MNEATAIPRRRRRWRWIKRLVIAIFGLVFLTVACLAIEWKWTHLAGKRKLEAATARLDVDDPGWRFGDIIAAHNARVPPPAENSGLAMVEIINRLPKGADNQNNPRELYSRVTDGRFPNEHPAEMVWQALETHYAEWEPGIRELRSWNAATPRGRFAIQYTGGLPNTIRLDNSQKIRDAAFALSWASLRFANAGEADRAIASDEASLHLLLSLDFEPMLIAHLIRNGSAKKVLQSVEQTLAWCPNAGDAPLARMQALVTKELHDETLKAMIRGERAFTLMGLELYDKGEEDDEPNVSLKEQVKFFYLIRKHIPANSVYCIERYDELLAILDKPAGEKYRALRDYELPVRSLETAIARSIIRAMVFGLRAEIQYEAKAICTVAGIACERYRLKHGRWPAQLDDLAEFGVPKGVIDPYDGQPLRYAIKDDGVIVYCVGMDEQDDEGQVVTRFGTPKDVGFRLWDVKSRKIPVPPPPKDDNDNN